MKLNKSLFSFGITSVLVLMLGYSSSAQQKINWMTWEEVVQKSKVEKKKIFVDIYTKWCGWCKKMDNSTFKNEVIIQYLNDNYYAVKFDAEYKDEITIRDQVFAYKKTSKKGYNTLAFELTRGKLSYPTIAFMDEGHELLQPIPGFRNSNELEMILTYFAEDHFKTTPWKSYARYYQPINRNNLEQKKNSLAQPAKYEN